MFVSLENTLAAAVLLAMVALPILEIAVRRLFGVGVPASGPLVQHLVLWVGFLGAAVAARDGKLLALATGTFIPQGSLRRGADVAAAGVAAAASIVLAWGGVEMVAAEREAATTIGAGIPTWIVQAVLPVSFGLIAIRLVWRASPAGGAWGDPLAASLGLVAGVLLLRCPGLVEGRAIWPGLGVIAVAAVVGTPRFAVLGGAAARRRGCSSTTASPRRRF